MAFAIDITNGMALVTKRILLVVVEKEQDNAVFSVHFVLQQNPFNQLYITNNMEHFSFKSGRAVCFVKLTKTDWFVMLQ